MEEFDVFNELEKKGVFIHYSPEHYKDGSNLMFSIEFTKEKKQTGWYNDNHEFGNVQQTIYKSTQLALWYLEIPSRIETIDYYINIIGNPEYLKHHDELFEFLKSLYVN